MDAQRHLVLVLENGVADESIIHYSLKLAKRMDCAISVLMLVSYDKENHAQADMGKRVLLHAEEIIKKEGIRVDHEIRQGDKASEFLKYIAVAPTIAAIIWGSDEKIVTGRRRKKSEHWFEKVRPHITYPIVTPRTRAKKDTTSLHTSQK
ncbi:MAG: hypothetical protein KKD44_15205 [Proteobacteria bacterium]|nr:hypothetical protein [Pseudomonadota bacterium]